MQSEERQECPECAEWVPAGVLACPLCGADLAGQMRPADVAVSLDEMRRKLDEHMGSGAYQQELATGSALLTTSTTVTGVLTAICTAGLVIGVALDSDAGTSVAVCSGLVGFFSALCFLVSFSHDFGSRNMAMARDPRTFVTRYMKAVLPLGREKRAYLATVPQSRAPGDTRDVDMGKIPSHESSPPIDTLGTFGNYWRKYIKRGPGSEARAVAIRKVHPAREVLPGVHAVDVDLRITSYPSALSFAFLLINVLVVILVLLVRKKHTMTVTKIVVEHRNRLFMLEPELIGSWDLALARQ
ncbi:MAG: hypothetical protein HN380_32005 [Victivallales bacterium]|jgi:hypothetical protein|nr:hypothetical protein [Victivallales bacterium]